MNEGDSQKILIAGRQGIGKTSLLKTLDPAETLFVDLEAGDLAVKDWPGETVRPRTWQDCRDLACFLGGPNPALRNDQAYSQAHYDYVLGLYGSTLDLASKKIIFFDSITVAGRQCLQYAKGQPEAFAEKTGKPDIRGAYGLHGQEMVSWSTQLQHIRNRDIIFSCILQSDLDDFNRLYYSLQIDGKKGPAEIPGIFDEVIVMADLPKENGETYRAFVCHAINPWGYPAKDRSGQLNMIEPPHLGNLMAKISKRNPITAAHYSYEIPTPNAQPTA